MKPIPRLPLESETVAAHANFPSGNRQPYEAPSLEALAPFFAVTGVSLPIGEVLNEDGEL